MQNKTRHKEYCLLRLAFMHLPEMKCCCLETYSLVKGLLSTFTACSNRNANERLLTFLQPMAQLHGLHWFNDPIDTKYLNKVISCNRVTKNYKILFCTYIVFMWKFIIRYISHFWDLKYILHDLLAT